MSRDSKAVIKAAQSTAAADAIGRPGPWQEGRHHHRDAAPEESVVRKPGEGPVDTISTPVTRADYERAGK